MAVNPTSEREPQQPTVSRGRTPSPRFPPSATASPPSTPGLPSLPRLPPTPTPPSPDMLPELDLRRSAPAQPILNPPPNPPIPSTPIQSLPPPTSQPTQTHSAPTPQNVHPPQNLHQSNLPPDRAPPARRVRGRPNRPGRPPNINENSLMRRLECVMAVESGRMSMLTACQQYDISARTFYRWLRNKDRLIELTGFTEDDFKDTPQPQLDQEEDRPADEEIDTPNLPRLSMPATSTPNDSNRPSKPFQPPTSLPAQTYAGSKRRFPKSTDPPRQPFVEEPFQHTSPSVYATRRRFTKMPSQTAPRDHDPAAADRHAARSATRMRRPDWPMDADMDPAYRQDERRFSQQFRDSCSNSPSEPFKRRKLSRPDHQTSEDDPDAIPPPSRVDAVDSTQDPDFYNGPPVADNSRSRTRDNSRSKEAAEMPNGSRAVEADPGPVHEARSESGKHRLEIVMGRRTVVIAWYDGASSEDIKAAIARRFALLPGTQWALMDKGFEEIIISPGVPSGRYTLTVFT